ncbi:hypothetical protein KI688_006190 [Linnemannia hyalina]|uniref:Kinesin motor domain-containing protein n=1 Tax=Linnemannia hyalina TaxID=64524 RepID=A0A9P7Y5X1_9FUNG|nr:hypothetical protein KI688_006190 [Linnemannia hyalina]
MSVSSTVSLDSTSSAESNRPEARASQMKITPVDQSIKTFLRIRPSDKSSSMSNDSSYLGVLNDTDVLMVPPPSPKQRKTSEYKFTRVFDESATQSRIFEETCLPLLTPLFRQDNYKALIFSHGVTKSGKTHSTIGSPEQAGIIPRTLKVLFDSIAESSQDVNTPTQYRPFRVHDVEINVDERRDNEAMKSIRALDSNLATWFQYLAIDPLDFNIRDLLVENPSNRNSQVVSLPEGMNYSIWISCAEISSERIYDLLATPSAPPVRSIKSTDPKRPQLFLTTDNATHQKYIQDLREVNVRTLEEAIMVLRAGYRQRRLYTVLTNRPSPRSHCIVTIKVLKTPQFGESALKDAAKGKTSISRLSIVDLAGSEMLRTMTSSAGHGIKDPGNGDTSLIVLGHCLKVLRSNRTTNSKNPQEVPFRQSKLTQLFQGSLEAGPANSQVCLIANISPYRSKFDETTRTLEFATSPIESSRTRIMDIHVDSETSLSNIKRLSTSPGSVSHQQPTTGQTIDDSSSKQRHTGDVTMLSQGQNETSDMDFDEDKSCDKPIEIESEEAVMVEKERPLAEQSDATTVSGSIHCVSVRCLETITSLQEKFDRHREAFEMQISTRDQGLETLKNQLAENSRKMEKQEKSCQIQDKEIQELRVALVKNDDDRAAQDSLQAVLKQEIKALRDQLAETERDKMEREKEILSRNEQVQELKVALAETIANRVTPETAHSLHQDIKSLTTQLLESARKKEELEERVRSRDEEVRELKQEVVDAEATRASQETHHNSVVRSLEVKIEGLRADLKHAAFERREHDEAMDVRFQEQEDKLLGQMQALADSLNVNHELELTQLREALVTSDKKCLAMTERFQSGDRDQSMVVLVRDLEAADETRSVLERKLAKANETIDAWNTWFADSPVTKLARGAAHASVPDLTTVAASDRSAPDDSLLALDQINTNSVAAEVLATIKDAGDMAVEQATLEEDFVEHVDEAIAFRDVLHDDPLNDPQNNPQGDPQGDTQDYIQVEPQDHLQDDPQDDPQNEPQGEPQFNPQDADETTTGDRTETVVTEQTGSAHIKHGNQSSDPSLDVKTVSRPAVSAAIAHPDFVNIIEIESDSEDEYHATLKWTKISDRFARVQQFAESSAESSRQSSQDTSDKASFKAKDSKLSTNKRTSTRSRSLPGHQETLTTITSRSSPARVTRSRYSLPNNPTVSSQTRSSAIQPPIKKTRLSTGTKSSLLFKDSDIDEDQERSQVEDSVGPSLPQTSKTSNIQTEEGVESGLDTTVVHPVAGSFETTYAITAQEPSNLQVPVTPQESKRVAAQGSPRDEDDAMLLAPGLVASEDDQEGGRSPDFTPENVIQPDLSLNFGVEDMQAEPSPDFEPEDDLPARPVQNAGPEDYLQADEYEMAQEGSHDGSEDTLARSAPGDRMELPRAIDDHIGTPAAKISPVRPIYPKLELMTPSPRRTSPSRPPVLSKYGAADDKWTNPTWESFDARLGEHEAPLETPDRLRSSWPRPALDVPMTKLDPSLTTERDPEYPLISHVDDDLDYDGERYHSRQVGDMDGDDESDGDKDLNGAISEYDSAQESLDTEDSNEFPLETKAKIDAGDKENDDPKSNKKVEPQSAKAMGKGKGKGEMKAIDDDELTVKDEDEDSESMKKDVMMCGLRPKLKKRKLRQAPTVFSDEMDEKVDMYVQPAKNNASKQLHRKLKSKSKSRMH